MAKKASPSKSSATKTPGAKKKQTELVAIDLPTELIEAMDKARIANRDEYITFLIASSLLNYQAIWKDEQTERKIKKIKEDSDHQGYLR
jgi:hypothetical protein